MQIQLPDICHFKNDGQKFMTLTHTDVPSQKGSDIIIKNPPYGFTPSAWV